MPSCVLVKPFRLHSIFQYLHEHKKVMQKDVVRHFTPHKKLRISIRRDTCWRVQWLASAINVIHRYLTAVDQYVKSSCIHLLRRHIEISREPLQENSM